MANGQNSLSEEQIFRLMKHLESRCASVTAGLRDYLIVSIMLQAGLRLGEAMQLTIEDVMLEEVPQEAISLPGHITKTGKPRSVPMCKALKGALIAYVKDWNQFKSYRTGLLFPGGLRPGVPITHRAVQKMLEKESLICLGISVHPHQLRHTFASRMMKITHLRNVQELLGHSSVRSTQIYTHPDQEDLKKAAVALDGLNKGL